MKILHITNNYAPVGGAEYYIYNVCSELEKRNHENIIMHGNKHNTTWSQNSRKAVFIEKIADFNCSLEKTQRALSIVKNENPDIVYLHIVKNATLIEKLIESKPTVQYVHNHDLYCPSGFMCNRFFKCPGRFNPLCFPSCLIGNCIGCKPFDVLGRFNIAKANRNAARKLNGLIVASEYMKQKLIDNGINGEKVYVIPYFTYPKEGNAQDAESNVPAILFAGRICKAKGPDYLIKALKYVKQPYRLIIAGDGYYMNQIRKLSKRLGVDNNIEFRGWLSVEELDICYRQAWLVAMPSIWPEPFGITGIEAMSYARPVVAFDVGGISQWLYADANGFLITLKDIHALANRINQLIEDNKLRRKMGEEGKRICTGRFSPERHIGLLEDTLKDILNRNKNE